MHCISGQGLCEVKQEQEPAWRGDLKGQLGLVRTEGVSSCMEICLAITFRGRVCDDRKGQGPGVALAEVAPNLKPKLQATKQLSSSCPNTKLKDTLEGHSTVSGGTDAGLALAFRLVAAVRLAAPRVSLPRRAPSAAAASSFRT